MGARKAEQGWFADIADEEDQQIRIDGRQVELWQPFLQLDGYIVRAGVWFSSEADCERFIHEELIYQGFLP